MKYWIKYGATAIVGGGAVAGTAYIFPEKSFLAFVIGWLFLLPAVFAGYMVYGYWQYMMERKHSIIVRIKPEVMEALARKEAELKKEILYEKFRKS